ncbi:MAG: hypothetical protein U0599_02395 [Vicinamibacteria bacterium]
MRRAGWITLALAAGIGTTMVPRAGAETETFTATLLQQSDMRQSRTRSVPVTFRIESWTSPQEAARLDSVLQEGGPAALLREFRKGRARAGYILTSAPMGEPSWRVAMATVRDTPRGRLVRLVTDRPIGFAESRTGARSLEYPFSVFEFTVDGEGRGQGIAIPAARLAAGEGEGALAFETLPYVTGPDRLLGVRQWSND